LLLAAREITPAQARPRAGRPRAARVSNAWRVSFRAPGLAAPKPARRSYGRRLGRARETQSCLGAAARFEALRRLAENPAAYARRLARALRRDPGAQMRIALAPIRACDPFAENAQEARDYIVRKSAFADSS
ncbi:MAG: hypothetical protein AB7L65_11245, partial [Hyphomonadaceae bacterium]